MKHVTKTTHYWIFEKAGVGIDYFHVRCKTDGSDAVSWFMGRVNHMGTVSSVGPSYTDELSERLEKRFSETPISEID